MLLLLVEVAVVLFHMVGPQETIGLQVVMAVEVQVLKELLDNLQLIVIVMDKQVLVT